MRVSVNVDEALRYAGVPAGEAVLRERMSAIAARLEQTIQPRCTWKHFHLSRTADGFALEGTDLLLCGHSAERMLKTCHSAVLMVCTLGTVFDDLLRTAQRQDMAEAMMMDACGGAMVEAACDATEKDIAARFPGQYLTDRFSPGYGDLPLTLQPGILRVTDSLRRVGVTMLPSYLMNPTKTVTAVIGIADEPQAARIRGCAYCMMNQNCSLRKGGKRCE